MIDAIVVSDAQGTILRINAAASHIFGHKDGALIGESINALMPPEMRHKHDHYVMRYLETGEPHIMAKGREIEGMRRDGTLFPLHVTLGHTALDGEMLFIAMMHDITERKHAETALNHASRMEAIGQLTGGFAHDFNNLLTIAIGNLELLRPTLPDASQLGMLQDALESVELGAELTAHLLTFARRSILEPVMIDINAEVTRAVRLLRHTLNRGIEIETRLAPDIGPVLADPARLQTTLLNLAVNAQDAMPEGGHLRFETATVCARTDPELRSNAAKSGDYVRISVCDTGIGMDAETVRQAFEPFFTTKPIGRGTGLGLSMVHGFIHQSEGHTAISSRHGDGTTMHLYLPTSSAPSAALGQSGTGNMPTAQGHNRTVLVVEDDDGLRRLTVKRVQSLGYRALQADNAKSALEIIDKGVEVDLLFTDIVMLGEMDGRALAERVTGLRPDIIILLTTGFSERLIADQKTETLQFEVLQKPYHQTDLAQILARLLEKKAR